jgi:hypothetical protein
MPDRSRFHVTLTTTSGFLRYVAASVASLREHNPSVAVTVFADEGGEELDELSRVLNFQVQHVAVDPDVVALAREPEQESVRSRLVKIHSMATATVDAHLYLDSDTILRGDIGGMYDELGVRLGRDADLFMLLRRPVPPTLWAHRHLYFTEPDIGRSDALALLNSTFDIDLPERVLDDMVCWNSGVILGSAAAMRRLGTRWLELYRVMLRAARGGRLIMRDQLSMWLAIWEFGEQLRIAEMPPRWNFMAGHLLDIPEGTRHVDEARLAAATVLHLAQNKSDPWAKERVDDVLLRSGTAAVLARGRRVPDRA